MRNQLALGNALQEVNCRPTNPTKDQTMTKTLTVSSVALLALIAAVSAQAGSCCASGDAQPTATTTVAGQPLAAPLPAVLAA